MGHVIRQAVERAYRLGIEDCTEDAAARYRRALDDIAFVAADGHLAHPGFGGLPVDWQPRHESMAVEEWVVARADLALHEHKNEMLRQLKAEEVERGL